MARFKSIYIRRSDGKQEVVVKGKRRETNEPLPEQLDTTPDKYGVSDFYREVAPDESKSLDWRRKLGGMIAREMRWDEGEYGYMLMTFPEGYRLYEHIKKTTRDGKIEVKSKTHAAGGNDRQDAYLYGYPAGRKKRFRSPADFFPHVLWLLTDESGDPDNCGCKLCSPEELEAAIPGAKAKAKVEKPIKQERDSIKLAYAPPLHQRASSISQSGPAPKIKQESGLSSRPAIAGPIPTPLPKPRVSDQQIDRQYFNFMYRPGELVWFKRGQAWGLGVVLRRWHMGIGQSTQYTYSVQPLSFPNHGSTAVVKSTDYEFRPWLAWSVPKFTHDGLNNMQEPFHYDNADWQGMQQKRYGHGEMEVDASILAAKAVDATYTPFSVIQTTQPEPGVTETRYNGVFLGAEKLWVGDPIRLQVGSGTDIMILHHIIERRRASMASSPPTVQLIGDVYSLTSVPHRPGDSIPNIPSSTSGNAENPYLPHRLVEDLRDRNNRSIAAKGTASYWKLIAAQSRLGPESIKGRWYEASLLLPVLQQAQYQELARKGDVQEASLWMNARGDCQNSNRPAHFSKMPRPNLRKETRESAFGKALPLGVEIKDGIEPPLPEGVDPALDGSMDGTNEGMQIDPKFDSADNAGDGSGGEAGGGAIDEFMNLEGDTMPGFGNEYAGQASQSGFY
ncbi:hypothetical protein LTR56_003232 [Elasticomyces elasticus]|nr:hypothetical protein LTR22_017802 [Elasticomyces elasticus]KAK3656100.1 hypothetical protein LTR56_003232 [Elasticomyces elasticus]KAK4922345.1 hypothetical protein LTR49_010376 [Elasticomyces elasticus]KAK5763799.1 hypothetical protein LTS12_006133 [Elasticomyces elasticus]